jgi:HNH endonuclease
MSQSKPTAERVRELLSYDPDTGVFRWIKARRAVTVGAVAGSNYGNGYLRIKINDRAHLSHRLAWLYAHGEWPAAQIDHINGIRSDNRLVNLREATPGENQQNVAAHRSNPSRRLGVAWDKRARKWRARIKINRKEIYLGLFENIEDAADARAKAKTTMHKFQPFDREI